MAIAMVIACAWPLHLPLNNPNEGVRVFAARSLAVHHTWAIDNVIKEWGFIDDKARCESVALGARCSSKAPYPTMIAAAASLWLPHGIARDGFTWWARWWGDIVPALLLWWGALAAIKRTAHLNDDTIAAVTVAVMIGSGVLAGMTVFSGHATSAAAIAWLMALAMRTTTTARESAIAGAMASMALGFEYTSALVVVPAVLAWLWQHRQPRMIIIAVVMGIVAAAPMMVAHHQQFGAPWRTGYSSLDNPAYAQLVNPAGFHFSAQAIGEALLSPSVGLLWFSPWLLVAAWGWRNTHRVERIVVVIGTVTMLSLAAMFPGWRGGWSVGWRYGLPLLTLWLLPCARGIAVLLGAGPWGRISCLMMIGIGVIHSGWAGAFFPHLSDVMSAPVHRFVLPMIARGFPVHGALHALGIPSPWSSWLLALLVLLPWLLLLQGRRAQIAAAMVVATSVTVATLLPADAATAVETRRIMATWRPRMTLAVEGCTAGPPWWQPHLPWSSSASSWAAAAAVMPTGSVLVVPDELADRIVEMSAATGKPMVIARDIPTIAAQRCRVVR